jgi:Kef-type K+ transport system membrane component KefB
MDHAQALPLVSSLLLLIVCARLLGGLVKRWGQPALLGEMLAGILLGPAVSAAAPPWPGWPS